VLTKTTEHLVPLPHVVIAGGLDLRGKPWTTSVANWWQGGEVFLYYAGYSLLGFNFRQGQGLFPSLPRPDKVWGPPSLSSGYRRWYDRRAKLNPDLHLEPRGRVRWALLLHLHGVVLRHRDDFINLHSVLFKTSKPWSVYRLNSACLQIDVWRI
jgi:hypothetical protein